VDDLFKAAADLQDGLDRFGLRNCIIGGLTLQAWGELRLTRDADFSVFTGFVDEERKVNQILTLVTPRHSNAMGFALTNRVILGLASTVPVDIGLAAFDYEANMIDRSVDFDFGIGRTLRICSANDLVIMKMFAGRDQDYADIVGVLKVSKDLLDWNIIEAELSPLLEAIDSQDRLDWLFQQREK
jgi:hypothetical protein